MQSAVADQREGYRHDRGGGAGGGPAVRSTRVRGPADPVLDAVRTAPGWPQLRPRVPNAGTARPRRGASDGPPGGAARGRQDPVPGDRRAGPAARGALRRGSRPRLVFAPGAGAPRRHPRLADRGPVGPLRRQEPHTRTAGGLRCPGGDPDRSGPDMVRHRARSRGTHLWSPRGHPAEGRRLADPRIRRRQGVQQPHLPWWDSAAQGAVDGVPPARGFRRRRRADASVARRSVGPGGAAPSRAVSLSASFRSAGGARNPAHGQSSAPYADPRRNDPRPRSLRG